MAGAIALATREKTSTVGEFNPVIFGRSIMKPFQIKCVANVLEPVLSWEQKAISVSSHVGSDIHQAVAQSILGPARQTFMKVPWNHPCSGKHAGILRACELQSWPLHSYLETDHAFNANYLHLLEERLGRSLKSETVAPDGCKLPAIALPITELAYLYLTLPSEQDSDWIWSAYRRNPVLIGGPGRLDTTLMQSSPRVLAKEGADGLLAVALDQQPTALVIKLAHGMDAPSLHHVVSPLLRKLGINHPAPPAV